MFPGARPEETFAGSIAAAEEIYSQMKGNLEGLGLLPLCCYVTAFPIFAPLLFQERHGVGKQHKISTVSIILYIQIISR